MKSSQWPERRKGAITGGKREVRLISRPDMSDHPHTHTCATRGLPIHLFRGSGFGFDGMLFAGRREKKKTFCWTPLSLYRWTWESELWAVFGMCVWGLFGCGWIVWNWALKVKCFGQIERDGEDWMRRGEEQEQKFSIERISLKHLWSKQENYCVIRVWCALWVRECCF